MSSIMKELKLIFIEMENFKGCAHRAVELNGRDLTILGENGCGKTTHYDAVSWVLFGKDAQGRTPGDRTSDFHVKPNGSQGTGVMPTVTVVLEADGEPVTLKKVYRELWTKPRGCAEQRYSGNTTDCFIDDVPKKESEYKAFVSSIVTEEQWRLLTDVYYFCNDMPWKDRRALLFDLCKVGDDAAILAEQPRFAPLLAELGRHSLEDCRTRLRSERLKANKALDAYPIRMDECAKTVSDISDIDFNAVRAELARKQAENDEIQSQLSGIVHQSAIEKARNRLASASNRLSALENENAAHRQAQAVPRVDPCAAIQAELDNVLKSLADRESTFERDNADIVTAELRLDDYRKRWRKIGKEKWAGNKICPSCGQPLPAHRIEDAKAAFETGKRARQQQVVDDSELLKKDVADKKKHMETLDSEIAALRLKQEELSAKLEAAAAPEPVLVCDLPDYSARKAEINAELAQAGQEVQKLSEGSKALENELRGKAAVLSVEMDGLRGQLAKERVLADANARMMQYAAERQTVGEEVSRLDGLLFLADEFTRYKSQRITDAVNALFDNTRFRLFVPQVNGGLSECCDPILEDGRPYGTVSDGEKAKMGLDVINALMRAYDMRLPVFIDKAGEITNIPKLDTQTIIMKAVEGQKELKYA